MLTLKQQEIRTSAMSRPPARCERSDDAGDELDARDIDGGKTTCRRGSPAAPDHGVSAEGAIAMGI
jgi:hypothetical protein